MPRKKPSLMLLIASWALANCSSAPPNFVACANLGDEGHCVTYVKKLKFNVNNTGKFYTAIDGTRMTWDQVMAGSVLIPSDWFAELKTHFDTYCHEKSCPDGIGDWNSFANELGAHIKAKK